MKLFIANKNYSSWSLRAWLILNKLDIKHEEIMLKLFTKAFYQSLQGIAANSKVPAIQDGELTVCESLAIGEYISEAYCSGAGWPSTVAERAKARALSAEMVSSFTALRTAMPMNIRANRRVDITVAVQKDISRINEIFSQHSNYEGGWLFGNWSIVDAMYAPVVLRFKTYGVYLSPQAQQYCNHVLGCPTLKRWIDAALEETDIVPEDEAGEEYVLRVIQQDS
ncbi:glutathione S-transferase [Pseudoalteromonas xiamenensis]|uniref:Glutathione S-transferase n=1 Tax=Pseudoalteromonas xiamenensis TaxID=882626 RepID=A0A975DHV8_9GAMM|nr:glutathione S-transferase [Pseudoalteromonas xiamenensis]QTH71909.1 glutathione S-transferase [Pseudoalteromonas xiamenensis]